MKIRQVKKAKSRFFMEQKIAKHKSYNLELTSKYITLDICLEQLLESLNKKVYDEFQVHFKNWKRMKYKTLKTAFIKDVIKEGYQAIKINKKNDHP